MKLLMKEHIPKRKNLDKTKLCPFPWLYAGFMCPSFPWLYASFMCPSFQWLYAGFMCPSYLLTKHQAEN
jgi:hypothetical protein